ncbi:MAG: hypothetical protein Q9M29_08065, partial [Mariprofundaceae bacterium]|nr:hypothetical protein [Mariprofundaceae bacterium]
MVNCPICDAEFRVRRVSAAAPHAPRRRLLIGAVLLVLLLCPVIWLAASLMKSSATEDPLHTQPVAEESSRQEGTVSLYSQLPGDQPLKFQLMLDVA